MGLIKTGLALAGGYGLIKAAERAANGHEDKKQKRQDHNMHPGQPQMPYQGHNESQMGYMYQNQQYNHPGNPQWGPGYQQQPYYGQPMNNQSHQTQSRSIQDQPMYQSNQMSQGPPPYDESHSFKSPADCKSGSAREYYSQ